MGNVIAGNSAGEKAADYFKNGYHCAEAVTAAVLEALNKDPSLSIAHSTAFGGGFGRTFDEACGALSGSLIVIGQLYGRHNPGEDWDTPATLAQDIRKRFLERFNTTHCATLRDRFGHEKQSLECCNLVKIIAEDLIEVLLNSANTK